MTFGVPPHSVAWNQGINKVFPQSGGHVGKQELVVMFWSALQKSTPVPPFFRGRRWAPLNLGSSASTSICSVLPFTNHFWLTSIGAFSEVRSPTVAMALWLPLHRPLYKISRGQRKDWLRWGLIRSQTTELSVDGGAAYKGWTMPSWEVQKRRPPRGCLYKVSSSLAHWPSKSLTKDRHGNLQGWMSPRLLRGIDLYVNIYGLLLLLLLIINNANSNNKYYYY